MKKKETKSNKKLFIIVGSIVGILLIILIINTIIHWNDCCSCCKDLNQGEVCNTGCCKCEGAILKW